MKVTRIPAPPVVQPEGRVVIDMSETEAAIIKALLGRANMDDDSRATHTMYGAFGTLPQSYDAFLEGKESRPVSLIIRKKAC